MEDLTKKVMEEERARKIALIEDYDKSEAVNSFLFNGKRLWLDKNTRVGLVNSVQIAKASGAEHIVLWYGSDSFIVPCDIMLQMLAALELYAMECYNVTAKHLAAVKQENDLGKLHNYKYTQGYPKRLNFNL